MKLLLTMSLLFLVYSVALAYQPVTRTYYVAAEDVVWDYAPTGLNLINNKELPSPWGEQTKYKKVRYIEYTDTTFSKKKEQPAWLGIMGPVIRAVEGDTIKVVFKNKAAGDYSIHPHGVFYTKDNEGACYGLSTIKKCAVKTGETRVYTWRASEKSAPGDKEGGSKVWLYHSHINSVSDIYNGLLGGIIITAKEFAGKDGLPIDVDKEFISLYFIFDESNEGMSDDEAEGHLMHSINGYIFGNQPGLVMKKDDKVRWHLLGMGTEVDIHTPHWHGNVVSKYGVYTDIIELLPATMLSVDMVADNAGQWLYHCHVTDHITAGMISMYDVIEK